MGPVPFQSLNCLASGYRGLNVIGLETAGFIFPWRRISSVNTAMLIRDDDLWLESLLVF